MITLELEEAHAAVARANLAAAHLDHLVEVRVGSAKDSLSHLIDAGAEAFDLIFIDADKESNPLYVASALRLSHAGTLIVVDNVVRSGALADEDSSDSRVRATRAMFDLAGSDPRVEGTVIQTVGAKGYDGFALFRVS
jgi:predicted O-methyltransferase YrrM